MSCGRAPSWCTKKKSSTKAPSQGCPKERWREGRHPSGTQSSRRPSVRRLFCATTQCSNLATHPLLHHLALLLRSYCTGRGRRGRGRGCCCCWTPRGRSRPPGDMRKGCLGGARLDGDRRPGHLPHLSTRSLSSCAPPCRGSTSWRRSWLGWGCSRRHTGRCLST